MKHVRDSRSRASFIESAHTKSAIKRRTISREASTKSITASVPSLIVTKSLFPIQIRQKALMTVTLVEY